MTADPKIVAEFFTYSPMDIAVLAEQSREQLYIAKKTRWKYRRNLEQAFADYRSDCLERQWACKPRVPTPKREPQPLDGAQTVAALGGGIIFAGGSLGLFMLILWVISRAFK